MLFWVSQIILLLDVFYYRLNSVDVFEIEYKTFLWFEIEVSKDASPKLSCIALGQKS